MALKIISGKTGGALKVVLYGPEGIGKSTLAAHFPRPLFIDTEGSTRHMDVNRTEPPSSWAMLMDQVKDVYSDPSICSTLVLDTADWAEQLCISGICAKKELSGIEDMGYGKGYVYLAEEFGRLLNLLEEIVGTGVHVVLTAHAAMRKFEQPDEMGAYDRWELKLQKKTAQLVKEWSDLLLFANYKTISVAVDKQGTKHKAQGGKRVIYTSHHPCWDAKNRLGMPDELPLDFAAIRPYLNLVEQPAPLPKPSAVPPVNEQPTELPVKKNPDPEPAPEPKPDRKPEPQPDEPKPAGYIPAVLEPLLKSADVSEHEVREVIAKRQKVFPMGTTWEVMEKAGFVTGWVLPFWDNIVQMIRENPDRLPF